MGEADIMFGCVFVSAQKLCFESLMPTPKKQLVPIANLSMNTSDKCRSNATI